MAGDWIKMRAALMSAPKLIALSRHLHRSNGFREWLTPGGSGSANGQIVSDDGLRCVTCSLLLRVWSASREFGKPIGNDLILPHIEVSDIDAMAGAPGVGDAMLAVGWATRDEQNGAVILPNFKQHNAPMTSAEKQSQYRERSRGALPTVTSDGNKTVTREEKRREDIKDISKDISSGVSASQVQAFVDEWNWLGDPFPRCVKLSDKRRKSLKARLADPFWSENWRQALQLMKSSDFCKGSKGWTADVEFFLRPDTVAKLIEGSYRGTGTGKATSKIPSDADLASYNAHGGD